MRTVATIVMATALCALAMFTAVGSHAARTAFPGLNGRIVFNDQGGALDLVNPDGTGLVRLAATNARDVAEGSWEVKAGSRTVASGRIANLDIAPGIEKEIQLQLPSIAPEPGFFPAEMGREASAETPRPWIASAGLPLTPPTPTLCGL